MRSSLLIKKLLFFLGFVLLVTSCGSDNVEEIKDDIDHTPHKGLSEGEIKKIIDDNVVAHAKYTSSNCQYILECNITTSITNKIPNASINYGVEYGLDEPWQWYVEFENKNGSLLPLAISIVIKKPETSLDMYVDYRMYYGTYKALKDKQSSGAGLSKSEQTMYKTLVEKFNNIESYMKNT